MKKLVKLALSLAVTSTALAATLAVNANAENVSLVYDEANSTSEVAYVSLVTDVASVPSYEVTIGSETAQIASFEVVEALAGMNHNITTPDQAAVAVTDGNLLTTAYVSGEAATVPESGVIWTVKITFTEALTSDAVLSWLDYSYVEGGDGEWIDSDTLTASCTVLANPNAGGVDTRADFEAVPATEVGTYVDDTTTVPVKAWVASIDYEVEKLAEGAKLAWAVEGASETIETGSNTTVSGEGVVFYGFAVAGRADELASIGTVTLVAE